MPDVTQTTEAQRADSQPDAFELLLKPENQDALRTIVEELPKLASVMRLFGKLYDAAEEVLSDGDTVGAIEEIVRNKAQPVLDKYKSMTTVVRTAKNRAEQDTTQYGVFGILKLLKEPALQKNLRFVQAFLAAQSEHNPDKKL